MPDEFERHRARCFALAYRMLGSRAEAEDIVQEAWLRWQRAGAVESPGAWLTTAVTRLCLDHAKSARVRRERYVGPWLPEPLETAGAPEVDPDSISMAFLLVLERLSPMERAVYLLRQVFDADYPEIGEMLGKNAAAARQLFHRARAHLKDARPRHAPSKEEHLRLLSSFMLAVQTGEVAPVEALLAEDARAWSDGGGKVRAALKVVHGSHRVARLFTGLVQKGGASDLSPEMRELNGWPALLLYRDGAVVMAVSVETDGEKVHAVHLVTNPEKLARISPS